MNDPAELPIERLMQATVRLFHRLREVALQVHGEAGETAARRGVLFGLAAHGPATIAGMARLRPVSRQHIQAIVRDLSADGLVELIPNPDDGRSPLVRLTRTGRGRVRAMRARERRLFGRLDLDDAELERAAGVLVRVRAAFEDELGAA